VHDDEPRLSSTHDSAYRQILWKFAEAAFVEALAALLKNTRLLSLSE
jgi:hypothetical protein